MITIFFKKPLALACAAFLAALLLLVVWDVPHTLPVFFILLGILIPTLVITLIVKKKRIRRFFFVSLLFLLLLSLAFFCAYTVNEKRHTISERYHEKTYHGQFLVYEIVRYDGVTKVIGTFQAIGQNERSVNAYFFTFDPLFSDPDFLRRGDLLEAEFYLESTEEDGLLGLQSIADGIYLKAEIINGNIVKRDIRTAATELYALRERFSDCLEQHLSEDGTAMMKALLLADKSGIDRQVKDVFSVLGISHLFAVSGLHLSILIGFIAALLSFCRIRRGIAFILLAAITLFYMMLTGFAPSMLRAGGMLLLFYLSFFSRRKRDSVTALFAATTIIVLISPTSILDIGLLMSFLATLGILLIASPCLASLFKIPFWRRQNRALRIPLSLLRYLVTALVLSLSATAAILPLLYLMKAEIFIFAFLSNLVFTPLFSILLFLLPLFFVALPIAPLMTGIAWTIDRITGGVFSLALWGRGMSDLSFSLDYPFMPWLILLLFCALAFLLLKRLSAYLPMIPILCFFLVANLGIVIAERPLQQSESLYYYTNQTNDSLIISHEKKVLVVDFSASSSFLSDSFDQVKERHPSFRADTLMLTSCHNNHLRALTELLEDGDIANLVLPKDDDNAALFASLSENEGIAVSFYTPGDTIFWNSIALTTYPDRSKNSVAALDIKLAHKSLLYLKENAPMLFDIRFGPLAKHRDVIFLGASGSPADGYPFVFDADIVVQGTDIDYVRQTDGMTLLHGNYLVEDSRRDP